MKKMLVVIVLGFAVVAAGQTAAQQPQAQPAASQQPAGQPPAAQQPGQQPAQGQPQQKKEIKDPAEYNAYVGAIQQKDPAAKISGLEAFLTQYPNSVMKEDALEALMGAYQQSNNAAKMTDTAQRVLQANPNNLRALALLAYTKRAAAEANQNPQQNLAEGAKYAERGLQAMQTAPKPEGMSDADFDKLKKQTSAIFNGVDGIAALQATSGNQRWFHADDSVFALTVGPELVCAAFTTHEWSGSQNYNISLKLWPVYEPGTWAICSGVP